MIKHELSDGLRVAAPLMALHTCRKAALEAADALDALQIKANKYDLLMDALLTMTGGAVTHGDKPDPQVDTLLDKVKECRELRAEVERRDAAARKAIANMTGFGTEEDPVTVLAVFGQTTADKNRELLADNAKLRGEVERLQGLVDLIEDVGVENDDDISFRFDGHNAVYKNGRRWSHYRYGVWQKDYNSFPEAVDAARSQTPNGGEVQDAAKPPKCPMCGDTGMRRDPLSTSGMSFCMYCTNRVEVTNEDAR